jgi:hypothetical protein
MNELFAFASVSLSLPKNWKWSSASSKIDKIQYPSIIPPYGIACLNLSNRLRSSAENSEAFPQ